MQNNPIHNRTFHLSIALQIRHYRCSGASPHDSIYLETEPNSNTKVLRHGFLKQQRNPAPEGVPWRLM